MQPIAKCFYLGNAQTNHRANASSKLYLNDVIFNTQTPSDCFASERCERIVIARKTARTW